MAKTPKKFRGMPEKASLSRYYITGGVCSGYTVRKRDGDQEIEKFENMWDAIYKRKELESAA